MDSGLTALSKKFSANTILISLLPYEKIPETAQKAAKLWVVYAEKNGCILLFKKTEDEQSIMICVQETKQWHRVSQAFLMRLQKCNRHLTLDCGTVNRQKKGQRATYFFEKSGKHQKITAINTEYAHFLYEKDPQKALTLLDKVMKQRDDVSKLSYSSREKAYLEPGLQRLLENNQKNLNLSSHELAYYLQICCSIQLKQADGEVVLQQALANLRREFPLSPLIALAKTKIEETKGNPVVEVLGAEKKAEEPLKSEKYSQCRMI